MARKAQPPAKGAAGLLRTAERMGFARGVAGGKKGWFYVGTGLWTLRTVRRMAERKSEVLVSETLLPGQRMVIANGRATVEQDPAQPLVTAGRAKKAKRSKRRKG